MPSAVLTQYRAREGQQPSSPTVRTVTAGLGVRFLGMDAERVLKQSHITINTQRHWLLTRSASFAVRLSGFV